VKLATQEYRLSEANAALHDLVAGKVNGRAVLIP
jgi:NAD+-dependent secondary alcohol dehydrogenase Adh1